MEDEPGSAPSLRASNRLRVIQALQVLGVTSRAELARRTGLSRSTVSKIVAELQDEGMVVDRDADGARPAAQGGRPPDLISLDPPAGLAVGIDFGKRHLAVAVADLSHQRARRGAARDAGRLRRRERHRAGRGSRATRAGRGGARTGRVARRGHGPPRADAPAAARWARRRSSRAGPGPRGRARWASRLGLPVRVSNDANLGALAEPPGAPGAAAATWSTSSWRPASAPGSSMDGRLFGGAGGTAGEIGHTIARRDRRHLPLRQPRLPGDATPAAPAIAGAAEPQPRRATRHGGRDRARAVDGDPGCRRALADAGRHIGAAVANLCNLDQPRADRRRGQHRPSPATCCSTRCAKRCGLRAIPSAAGGRGDRPRRARGARRAARRGGARAPRAPVPPERAGAGGRAQPTATTVKEESQ